MIFDCHHDKYAIAVMQKFPTAVANWNPRGDAGSPVYWWISDNGTGAVLSETNADFSLVSFPSEQDAWESAYLFSVLGKTVEDIKVAAYYLWILEGRPEGEALDNWLAAKGELEA